MKHDKEILLNLIGTVYCKLDSSSSVIYCPPPLALTLQQILYILRNDTNRLQR